MTTKTVSLTPRFMNKCSDRMARVFDRGGIAITLGAIWLLSSTPAWAAPQQVLRGVVPAAVANHSVQPLERLAATNRLNVAIGLPGRNPEALTRLLGELYDPASTNFHQFLTTEQFTESFGPSEQDYQAVIAFANAHGLTVTATYPNRMIVDVSASVAGRRPVAGFGDAHPAHQWSG